MTLRFWIGAIAATLAAAPFLSFAADDWSLEAIGKLPCDQVTKRLKEGIEAKSAEAVRTTGILVETGQCFAANPRAAASFYQRASDAGDRPSRERLALLFAAGKGVDQDYASAGALLRQVPPKPDETLTTEDYTRGYAFLLSAVAAGEFAQRKMSTNSIGAAYFRSLPFSFDPSDPTRSVAISIIAVGDLHVRQGLQRSISEVLEFALPKLPAPDKTRLVPTRFSVYFVSHTDAAATVTVEASTQPVPASVREP